MPHERVERQLLMTVDDSQGLKNRAVVWIESLLPVTGRLAQNFLKQVLTIKTPVLLSLIHI